MKQFIVACMFVALGCDSGAGGAAQGSGGRAAADFTLKDLDGKAVSLSSFRGKPVLLTFWAVG